MHFNAKFRPLVASAMLLSATQAHATLTSYTSNGVDVVYSSVSDVTWTKDANLLGSMFASQGFNTVVNAIIAASPTISDTPNSNNPTGTYNLSMSDFESNGRANWYGSMAYINYLNSISYGGSKAWRLPTVTDIGSDGCNWSSSGTDCGDNVARNGLAQGDELAELYYDELGSLARQDVNGDIQSGFGIQDNENKFVNLQSAVYWSETEEISRPHNAWLFNTRYGFQSYDHKVSEFDYAWAVSSGQISAVPAPPAVWLFGSGLLGVAGFARRKIKPCN